jgi:hypothetical protein
MPAFFLTHGRRVPEPPQHEPHNEESRKMKLLVIAAVLVAVVTPASAAEYYVMKKSDKPCGISASKPQDMSMVVGGKAFATKAEAMAALNASADCSKKKKK